MADILNLADASNSFPDKEERAKVQALQSGSEEAFDWLIAEYTPSVYRLAYRILNDRCDASDAVQDVFLKVFRSIGEFHGGSTLKTWIFRITVNTASNQNRWWRRHKKHEFSLEEQEEEFEAGDRESMFVPADQGPNPYESLLSREKQEIVHEAMERLPAYARTILVLREMEGLSYDEIGEILHLATGTVKSRIARAREALKGELEALINQVPNAVPVWKPVE